MGVEVNDMDEWHTVTETAKKVDIPPETIRRYCRNYGDYLRLRRGEKRSYLIHKSSFDTIKKIRHLLEQGKLREQVEEILQRTETLTIHPDDNEMNEYFMSMPQLQREQLKHIKKVYDEMKEQRDVIEDLRKKVEEQEQYIREHLSRQDDLLKERDRKLNEAMNEILETQRQLAAEGNKGFFSRLFKK